ncbi:hypothetical protein [Streptomyces sp. NBC_01235]|uniref:hypothetical protein n=1 Tax=Streptomyces sp. NBC_01235 TaxID=2903788 RepID=UPI002E143C67
MSAWLDRLLPDLDVEGTGLRKSAPASDRGEAGPVTKLRMTYPLPDDSKYQSWLLPPL